jgi:PiT family inorganic phosphate transporter
MPEIIILIIALTILFEISNGWNDSANAIATVISTRVLSPLQAIALAAMMNILGAFFSTAVAKTIGEGVVNPGAVTNAVVVIALAVSFLWNAAMTWVGMPISCSHALIGALMGSSMAFGGYGILNFAGLKKIFLSLLVSPVVGLIAGYIVMRLLLLFFGRLPYGTVNRWFGKLQMISAALMGFSHGSNDAQKGMGIITLALVSAGTLHSVRVPWWVIVVCALAIGTGTAVGGWRVIKTLGVNILKLEPVHGFAAETSAAATILVSSHFGLPVSTTHVITTAVMGVGSTKRFTAVRWGVASKILTAWIFTLPVCFGAGWLIMKLVLQLMPH